MTLKENKILFAILLFDFIGILLTLVFNSTAMADEFEHLRASYLVSLGNVPYRDFFEHHHPLLWFTFAPIIGILPHKPVMILYIAKALAFICSALTFYIIFLMFRRFWRDYKVFGYFLALVFLFYPLWYSVSIFKPDTFARLFYFCGLYFFMCYIEKQQLKSLIWCGISFCIAFLFIQTIAFSILPLCIPALYLFYKNPRFYKDVAISAILPCSIIMAALALLYYSGSIVNYWQENILFNQNLFHYLCNKLTSVVFYWALHIVAGFIAGFWLFKKQPSIYTNIIFLLFVSELIQHLYFPAVFPHYLVLLFIFMSMLIALVIPQIKNQIIIGYFYAFLAVSIALNFVTLGLKNNLEYMRGYKIVNQSPTYDTLHITFNFVNIYAPMQTFYTLFPHHFAWLDNYLFNRFPDYDVNSIIKNPAFVYLDYLPKDNIVPVELYHERFILSEENLQNYEEISHGLYRRKNAVKSEY